MVNLVVRLAPWSLIPYAALEGVTPGAIGLELEQVTAFIRLAFDGVYLAA